MQEDKQLILEAKKGNNKAFEQLVNQYDRLVLNIAYSYCNCKDDGNDIYQEVFIRVHKGLRNFQFRSKFSTWLYRITVNVCIEHKRKESRNLHETLNSNNDSDGNNVSYENIKDSGLKTDKMILDNETASIIDNEVEKLPKQLKMAFALKYYQGMKIREISSLMNCSEGTIKSYLFTSTRKLRVKLKPILR